MGGQTVKEAQEYIREYLKTQSGTPEPVKIAQPSTQYKEIVRNANKRWEHLEAALEADKKT